MLSEQRRLQLDSIVQQMVRNKEKDADVQWVVNDFKKKYENENIQSKKETSLLSKVGSAFTSGNVPVLKQARDLMFGTTGKTVGGLVSSGIGSAAQLYGQATDNKQATEFGTKLRQEGEQEATPSNIAFTALELYPGGGQVTKVLNKIPGGTQALEYISKLPEGLKKKAIEQYSSIFNATSKESKALVKETVPDLLEKGIKITSPESLVNKAEAEATTYGEKIDKYFKELPQDAKEKTKPILDKLSALKNEYMVDGKVIKKEAVNAIDETMNKISQFGDEVSTGSARKLKQIFDEHYDISKGLDDISTYTKKAERAGADAIRAEFAKTRPDLAKISKEYSFWKNVKDLGTYTAEKGKGKFTKGISSVIGGAVGFESGTGVSGKASGAIIGAFLGTKAIDLMRSPAWKSISAIEKNRLAESIMKGDKKTAELILTKMTTGIKNISE